MITRAKKANSRRSAAKPRQKRFGQTDKRVHRDLHAAIIDHSLSPGTALQEDALATAFGVSRTVIRKILQHLALERLLDIVPNRGAAVAKPTAEEAREVFEARLGRRHRGADRDGDVGASGLRDGQQAGARQAFRRLPPQARAYALATGSIALQGASADLLRDDRVKALYLGGDL